MEKFNLNNAIQLSIQHESFKAFDFEKEYKKLKVGDIVKVCRKTQFYHVIVNEIINFQFLIGKIIELDFLAFDSIENYIQDTKEEDKLQFSFENAYDIVKINELIKNNELGSYVISELMLKGKIICRCGECNDAFYINAYNKFYEFKNKKEEKK